MSETRNKGGRPRKHPVGPRTNLTVRLPTSLRNRLYDAAQADGRSLAEMIERACEAHLAGSDIRALIREEIRAALAERDGPSDDQLRREAEDMARLRELQGKTARQLVRNPPRWVV